MRIFHFIDQRYGIDDLKNKRIKISRIHQLNDPFEFIGVDLTDPNFRKAIEKTKFDLSAKNGLLCFSKNWRNPVLWSHYAEKHHGLCFGFDVPDHALNEVEYVKKRIAMPASIDEKFTRKLVLTKFEHWKYEEEMRIFTNLDEDENGLYFANFGDNLILREVIIGCDSKLMRSDISPLIDQIAQNVSIFKVRPDYRNFSMVRNNDFNAC